MKRNRENKARIRYLSHFHMTKEEQKYFDAYVQGFGFRYAQIWKDEKLRCNTFLIVQGSRTLLPIIQKSRPELTPKLTPYQFFRDVAEGMREDEEEPEIQEAADQEPEADQEPDPEEEEAADVSDDRGPEDERGEAEEEPGEGTDPDPEDEVCETIQGAPEPDQPAGEGRAHSGNIFTRLYRAGSGWLSRIRSRIK